MGANVTAAFLRFWNVREEAGAREFLSVQFIGVSLVEFYCFVRRCGAI